MTAPALPSPAQVAAYDAGRTAYTAGDPSTTLPHRTGDLRVAWLRGYVLARRDALYSPQG